MVIGIVGGGQLARMMVLAGYPMGQAFVILDPAPDAAAGQIAPQIVAPYDDEAALDELAHRADVITFDFENVPAAALARLARHRPVYPPAAALRCAQDRLEEKNLFERLGIPTAPWRPVAAAAELARAAADIGLPAVLKTRRLGYDGKGQTRLAPGDDLEAAWRRHGGAPSILEAFVSFEYEVSLIGVRGRDGTTAFYPLARNVHRDGILRLSIAPHRAPALQAQAEAWLERIMAELDYVGVLAVEFFVRDGALLANEMAPRVHNTGHWTIEGAAVSQFENHLRAVCGLPLGSTEAHSHAAMVNFIGRVPPAEAILAIPGCHFHDYGKAPRPGRKVGHATVRAADAASLEEKVQRLLALVDDEAEATRRAARPV